MASLAARNRRTSEAKMVGAAYVILVTSIRVFITTTMISSTYIFSIFILLRWSSKDSILGIIIDTNDFLLFAGVSEVGRSVVKIGWGHGVLRLVVLQCMR